MSQTTTPQKSQPHQPPFEDRLSRAIAYSVGLHVAVAAALTLRAVFYPSEPLLLDAAIRVDIVALPDKTSAKKLAPPPKVEEKAPEPPKPVAQPEPAPKPAPKVEIAKPEAPKVNLDKAKKDQQAALKRIEALQRLERSMKAQTPTVASAKTPADDTGATQVVKGNEISRGSDLKGIAKLEHQSYLRTIDQKVKGHWNLPQWLATANLSMRIRLYVDAQGNVIKKEVVKSSNQPVYDERVIQAIEASSPLPPPPGTLVNLLAVDGIVLEFVPQ